MAERIPDVPTGADFADEWVLYRLQWLSLDRFVTHHWSNDERIRWHNEYRRLFDDRTASAGERIEKLAQFTIAELGAPAGAVREHINRARLAVGRMDDTSAHPDTAIASVRRLRVSADGFPDPA